MGWWIAIGVLDECESFLRGGAALELGLGFRMLLVHAYQVFVKIVLWTILFGTKSCRLG